jgi:hypothetical protein
MSRLIRFRASRAELSPGEKLTLEINSLTGRLNVVRNARWRLKPDDFISLIFLSEGRAGEPEHSSISRTLVSPTSP